jgi:hypothetical protein
MLKNLSLVKIVQLFSLLLIGAMLIIQFIYINPYAASFDQVDFALGVERYDIMSLQPHFPGYPYFILGGKFIQTFLGNPAEALTVFNILFYFSSVFPIYRLMRSTVSKDFSLLLTAVIYSGSYTLVMVNQPMSEGAALAALWWYVFCLHFALHRNEKWPILLPLLVFSLVLGIRLSYLPFASGILYLFFQKWKEKQATMWLLMIYTTIAGIFQLVWVSGVAISEGGIKSFIKLSLAFTNGHFQDWGGSVSTVDPTLLVRVKTFIIENVLWTGFSAHNVLLLILYLLLFLTFFSQLHRVSLKNSAEVHLPILLFLSYLIWAFFAQNIDKPRHILPLIGFACWIMFLLLYKRKVTASFTILLVAILSVQFVQATILIKDQAVKKPVIYQLAHYVTESHHSGIVYTWEETRVLRYLNVPFLHKKILTYQYFLHDASYYADRDILLTDKVVAGFKQQGINIEDEIEKVEEFHSESLFDPVYHDITLYQWKKQQGVKKRE